MIQNVNSQNDGSGHLYYAPKKFLQLEKNNPGNEFLSYNLVWKVIVYIFLGLM